MKKKKVLITVAVSVAAVAGLGIFGYNFNEIKAGSKIEDINKVSEPYLGFTLPSDAKVIALGEATHGNADFQALKLDVLKKLVNEEGVRSFALETDFGGGMLVNRYIHGEDDDVNKAVNSLLFGIYRTEDVKDMLVWMRSYNDSAKDEDKLNFYGYDMQNSQNNITVLQDYCRNVDELKGYTDIMTPAASTDYFADKKPSADEISKATEAVDKVEEYLKSKADQSFLEKELIIAAENVDLCIENGKKMGMAGNVFRDDKMSEIVEKIRTLEESLARDKIMIAGHIGHVSKKGITYKNMGSILKEKLGNEYYVIGTDFFKTECSIGGSSGRKNYKVCSADPLAAQAKDMPDGKYYLDFSKVSKDMPEVYGNVYSGSVNGNLGESFTPLYYFIRLYRTNVVPADLYDSMIYVYDAKPLRLLDI